MNGRKHSIHSHPVYDIRRTMETPALDGWLEAAGWQQADWIGRFVAMDTWAPAKPAAVALLWDAATLYVGLKLAEPLLGLIRAEGDPLDQDDLVELYLDPGLPEIEYIVVGINAQGAVSAQKMIIDNPGWGTRHPMASEDFRCAARLTGAARFGRLAAALHTPTQLAGTRNATR